MTYLRKHLFFLIVFLGLAIIGARFYYLDLSLPSQWLLSILQATIGMITFIPLMWFWTERRWDLKAFRQIKYRDVLRKHPWRLLLQYSIIIVEDLLVTRPSSVPLIFSLVVGVVTAVILTPIYLDYFTNAELF